MGTYMFRWEYPAYQVVVTGTFDDWSKSVQLKKEDGVFRRQVDLPSTKEKVYYKFVVDGDWKLHPKVDTEIDKQGNKNNVLHPEEIQAIPAGARSQGGQHGAPMTAAAAVAAGAAAVGAGAVTAGLASRDALEKDPNEKANPFKDDPISAPNAAPMKTDYRDPRKVAPAFEKDVIDPSGNPPFFDDPVSAPGAGKFVEIERDPRSVSTAFAQDPIDRNGNPFFDDPISAPGAGKFVEVERDPRSVSTAFAQDPIDTKPTPELPVESRPPKVVESGGPWGKDGPPASDAFSGPNAKAAAAGGAAIATVGAGATTAGMAGDVPKEPRGVPEVVSDSKSRVNKAPEHTEQAVVNKGNVERELVNNVPEKGSGTDPGAGVAVGAAAAGAAVVGGGAVAYGASQSGKTSGTVTSNVSRTVDESRTFTSGTSSTVGKSIHDMNGSPASAGYLASGGGTDGTVTPSGPPIADNETMPAIMAANRGGATYGDANASQDPRNVSGGDVFDADPVSATGSKGVVETNRDPRGVAQEFNNDPISPSTNAVDSSIPTTGIISSSLPDNTIARDHANDVNKPFANRDSTSKAAPSPTIGTGSESSTPKKKKGFRKRFSDAFTPEAMRTN